MIKRRFYKLEHGDVDSGSDSSCFSSDSDPETEESEQSEEEEEEEEDSVAEVSEDDDDESGESDSPAADDDAAVDANDEDYSDNDDYGGRLKNPSMDYGLEEPPEEKEENYILGCMIQCKSVYKCRYCPTTVCLNETTMQAHVSSKKHARMEKLHKEGKLRTVDEEVDDPESPFQEIQKKGRGRQRPSKRSQKQEKVLSIKHEENKEVEDSEMPSEEKQIKENRKSRREQKRLQKLEKGSSTKHGEKNEVDNPETPSQEKQIKENSRSRRKLKRAQKQKQSSLTKEGENEDASQKSRKKQRQSKD